MSSNFLHSLFGLTGKLAYVTGGARGIGYAITHSLASCGCNVVIADIDDNNARISSQKINDSLKSNITSYCKCDVTDSNSIENMLNYTMSLHNNKYINIGINNAGIVYSGVDNYTQSFPLELWNNTLSVNLTSIFLCCKLLANKCMIENGGKIINIASMSGHIVNTPQIQCGYNASKAGVIQLTKSLAVEWAPYNINVNCISPGYTLTELTSKSELDNLKQIWINSTPMKRMAKPNDLIGGIIYLSSSASDFCTGMDLIIDGGFTCV